MIWKQNNGERFYHKFSFFHSAEGIFMLFQFIFSIKRELNKGKDPVKLNIAQMSLER